MNFNLTAFLITAGCCLISMVIAGKSGSKEDKEWFANLNHPDKSFLLNIMNILGVVVYLFFGFVLYHIIVGGDVVLIALMILLIQLNGIYPYLKYKARNLKLFFHSLLAVPVLVAILIFFLLQANIILTIPVIVFLLWVLYDVSYYYRLMKLNM